MSSKQATFGAGCFWGAEAFFREIDGVLDARVGYSWGTDGSTPVGRIEAVQVDFDPARVAYQNLVEFFWKSHDPTSVDRQGAEAGEGVRSAIFVHDEEQAAEAQAVRARFNASAAKPAVTQIIPFQSLELAEEKHQKYLEKNRGAGCSF